jgi:hypothetical protein
VRVAVRVMDRMAVVTVAVKAEKVRGTMKEVAVGVGEVAVGEVARAAVVAVVAAGEKEKSSGSSS